MTLYALLIYAVTSSTGLSDSDRMALVLANAYRDQPSLALVQSPQVFAPVCIEFCDVKDPQDVQVITSMHN